MSELSQAGPTPFAVIPDDAARKALAEELGLIGLRKLRFEGEIRAQGAKDWRLTGRLGATVVQPCVRTLEPVTTRIESDVARLYLRDFDEPSAPEAEMPEDDSAEALGTWIDPSAVLAEALALALPDYPRIEEDETASDEMIFTEPGVTPMSDADARPFASLAAFKKKLEDGET